MKILGLDVGIFTSSVGIIELTDRGPAVLGYSLFEDYLSPTTKKALRGHGQHVTPAWVVGAILPEVRVWIDNFLYQYRPFTVVCESANFRGPSKTFDQVAEVRGVLHLSVVSQPFPPRWEPMPPTVPKKLFCGSVKAEKIQIQRYLSDRFGLPDLLKPKNNHCADALALALAWIIQNKPEDGPSSPALIERAPIESLSSQSL